MNKSKSSLWWEKEASNHGLLMIDRMAFRNTADWDKVIESGKDEIHNVFKQIPFPKGNDLKLLEIGCGVGRLTFVLADYYGEVCGMDVSESFLGIAREHNDDDRIQFLKIDENRLLENDAAVFDVVFSMEVFHYLDLDVLENYIEDAFRLLVPGGTFVFQINTQPFKFVTRVSLLIRRILNLLGVKYWRDSPTSLDGNRKYVPTAVLQNLMVKHGFIDIRCDKPQSPATWLVGTKPSVDAAL